MSRCLGACSWMACKSASWGVTEVFQFTLILDTRSGLFSSQHWVGQALHECTHTRQHSHEHLQGLYGPGLPAQLHCCCCSPPHT